MRCRRWPDWRPARRMITPKRPGITPSRIFVAGLAALALLVLAACSSSAVREGGSRVSTPKYGATAVVKRGDNLYRIRSEEHTSELQSLMRISYAVFCLKKKKNKTQ